MDEYIEKWLHDILSAIREIEDYLALNLPIFKADVENLLSY
jgi:hypothetical protein